MCASHGCQNGTEAVQTYKVDTMIGDDGFTYEVQEDVTITLSKTPVRLDYPLVYRRVRRRRAPVCPS